MIAKSSLAIILLFISLACTHRQGNTSSEARVVSPDSDPSNQSSPKPIPSPEADATPEVEMSLGNGLKLVPKNVTLKNEPRRYEIDVTYPQIEGSKHPGFVLLNKRMKSFVTKQYAWPLIPPTKEDLRYTEKWPGFYNSVELDYDVVLATERLLSIYFEVYSYGIGAAHSVQHSFTINFDMKSKRVLTLASLFEPSTQHLRFISDYCIETLSKDHAWSVKDPSFRRELLPRAENYDSWNLTKVGLRFNFDACRIDGCAAGKAEVLIPPGKLKDRMRLGILNTFTST